MRDWAAQAEQACRRGPAALAGVLAADGSAPRGAMTRMVVTPTGILGTIGGGNLEQQVIRQARLLLQDPRAHWRVQDYPLGPLLGQCCGGRVRLLIERLAADDADWLREVARRHRDAEPFTLRMTFGEAGIAHAVLPDAEVPPPSTRGAKPGPGETFDERHRPQTLGVLLFGAGHVGSALARTLEPLPVRLRWRDTRPEFAARPGVDLVSEAEAVVLAGEGPEDEVVLIMTHDHALDYRLTAAALAGGRRVVGLIGSATKRARFLARLRRDGLDDAALARLVCPIGRPDIPGKEPEVIAVAVAAQLLGLRGGA
ncbi:MAG: hypothetical protein JWO72_30 [Caulobacteraceae bacterium]|nr:hypothetical protein [Caulobacteraceae bacterium]